MSDITDNNAIPSSISLTPEEVARFRAYLADQHSSTTTDIPRTKHLIISEEIKDLIPAISGDYFFFPPEDPDIDPVSSDDLLFNKNPHQQYTAPGWDLPFPIDRSFPFFHFEQSLVKILERQARSTWPLDDFAVDFMDRVSDPAARQAVGDFLQIMRSQLANDARETQELRNHNYLRAKGLQPIPDKKKGVSTSQDAIKASIKEAQEYAKALPPKKNNGGSGRGGRGGRGGGRGWGNGSFHFGQQQQRPPYQQQYQQQQPQFQQYPSAYQPAPAYQQQPSFGPQPQGYNDFSGYGQYQPQGFPRSNRGRGRGRGQSSQ